MKNRNIHLGSNGDLTFLNETELSVLLFGPPPATTVGEGARFTIRSQTSYSANVVPLLD